MATRDHFSSLQASAAPIASRHFPPNESSLVELPSRASRELLCELRRVARHDGVNICLVGPSGTGKSLYAEEVHRHSPRRAGPFVKINLASLEGGLAASELLGHVEGAYTGARGRRVGGLASANGGTLVLDEITKSTPQVQHILLHLFDNDPVRPVGSDRALALNVRFIALTSTPLDLAVRTGALIPDLFERLKTFVLEITPVAERRADIPVVLAAALRRHAIRFGYVEPPVIDDEVMDELIREPLSGNHRELDGMVQRMLVNANGAPVLRRSHLPRQVPLRASVEGASQRSRRQHYLDDKRTQQPPAFATVSDEARYYRVSVATIHRWRADQRGDSLSLPQSHPSHETLMRAD